MGKTIITCAVTGSADTPGRNPAVPVTPAAIAASAVEAARAGAAIVHLHVRDPETGKPSTDLALYREVVARIGDSGRDVIINLTTGPGQRFKPSEANPREAAPGTNLMHPMERVAHVVDLKPEICSLDVATMNSGGVFGDTVVINTPAQLKQMAAAIRAAGTKPELEVFDTGHVRLACQMVKDGHVAAPPFFQLALGVEWGAPASAEAIRFMTSLMPDDAIWAAFGISRGSLQMAVQSFLAGGHVRVGMEDNIYLSAGELAPSNAALVDQAVRAIEPLGAVIASPDEARAILALS